MYYLLYDLAYKEFLIANFDLRVWGRWSTSVSETSTRIEPFRKETTFTCPQDFIDYVSFTVSVVDSHKDPYHFTDENYPELLI